MVALGPGAAAAQGAPLFVFQNSFWVNLHQFLYAEAGRRQAGRATPMVPDGSGGSDRSGGSGRSSADDERVAWQLALDTYAGLLKRDLVFDPGLVAINDALARFAGGDTLPDSIEPAIRTALNQAAPVYRARAWARHQRTNDAWIVVMKPRLERSGPALTQALASAYHVPWPAKPILIDVSVDAGVYGGYTTNEGPAGFAAHSTIAPSGPGSEGDMGVETIFHEASHAVDAAIMRMIGEESARQNVRTPRNLWHALIFYTTGELVRRQLGRVGDSHYMPYAYRFDVYSKGMQADRAALERDWQPYLDGKVTFEQALHDLVRDATTR
jgi:hypothetical protein